MANDRIDDDSVRLTDEFLGLVLGTHRPYVSTALKELQGKGPISVRRNGIAILDRQDQEKDSNGTYVPPEGYA